MLLIFMSLKFVQCLQDRLLGFKIVPDYLPKILRIRYGAVNSQYLLKYIGKVKETWRGGWKYYTKAEGS